jgi:predicted Zn-dependent protease
MDTSKYTPKAIPKVDSTNPIWAGRYVTQNHVWSFANSLGIDVERVITRVEEIMTRKGNQGKVSARQAFTIWCDEIQECIDGLEQEALDNDATVYDAGRYDS